jgi:hypothetical protein
VQYAALFQLRSVKLDGVDDSDYIHALTYVDLDSEQFIDIPQEDVERLRSLTAALAYIVDERAVPPAEMRRVLTAEQHADYTTSFGWDISPAESDQYGDMPWQLRNYLDAVRQGDKHTRTANLFQRSTKRDAQGRTAFGRYEAKAFACYESAVMDLCNYVDTDPTRNPNPDVQLAGEIQRWLDRDVNPEPGYGPDVSIEGVPRVRGSKSRFALIDAQPVVGVRLRKHWRQREALSKAVLELLYAEVEEAVLTDEQRLKMRRQMEMLRNLHPERD